MLMSLSASLKAERKHLSKGKSPSICPLPEGGALVVSSSYY